MLMHVYVLNVLHAMHVCVGCDLMHVCAVANATTVSTTTEECQKRREEKRVVSDALNLF
jgi:heme/copper-type cytochrome/quinol oxidase subunit 3